MSDCHRSDAREELRRWRARGEGAPHAAISIAPVESEAEVMIERDATTARSDGQLYLVTVVHCSTQILSEIIFNIPFLSSNGRNSGQRFPDGCEHHEYRKF